MREITIKGKTFKINLDGGAYFRYGREGGTSSDFSIDKNRAPEAFANSVILTWAMLDDAGRAEYPTPEKFAELFLPTPSEEMLKSLAEEIRSGVEKLGLSGMKNE